MRINLGKIGNLSDESTRLKVIELSKEIPDFIKQYDFYVAMINHMPNADANLEITVFEQAEEPTTKLIPKKAAQKLTCDIWDEYTPYENKLELIDGEALWGDEQRDNMLLALVYNTGLDHFAKLLTEESKRILKDLL